jgi:hypothetical protein
VLLFTLESRYQGFESALINADPDPALISDPDPVPNPGFDDKKLEKIYS